MSKTKPRIPVINVSVRYPDDYKPNERECYFDLNDCGEVYFTLAGILEKQNIPAGKSARLTHVHVNALFEMIENRTEQTNLDIFRVNDD